MCKIEKVLESNGLLVLFDKLEERDKDDFYWIYYNNQRIGTIQNKVIRYNKTVISKDKLNKIIYFKLVNEFN